MQLDVEPYDKIILGFLGIVGDAGEKADTINRAAVDFQRKINEPTFCDSWGDVLSYNNCGFTGWVSDDAMAMFNEQMAQGVLGGLRKLRQQNPALQLSMSIGGWTMSQAFHFLAADAAKRATFCAGVIDLYRRFPMFNEIDLDWEYPGAPGNTGNTYNDEDTANYVLLIGDLKQAFVAAGREDVRISIAASANVDALVKTDIPAMLAAGLYGINLMTYDFFGTPWAPELAHHTNLHSNGVTASNWSTDAAIAYLREIGAPMNQVFIGYASYSRNARGAEISSSSPLTGTYAPGTGTTTGTFESGCTEWYDTIANYLDLENQRGRNGFDVYTDELADADYLYNVQSKLFMSIDTPRTVKAKGDYVVKNGLGGMFTWTIDQCGAVLVNAAREGLGCTIK
jgi:chitinase